MPDRDIASIARSNYFRDSQTKQYEEILRAYDLQTQRLLNFPSSASGNYTSDELMAKLKLQDELSNCVMH